MKTIYILAGYQQDGAEYCKIGDKGFEDGTSQVRVDEYYGTTGYGKDNEGYIRSAGRLNLDFERMTLINNNKLSYYYPLKKYNASYDSIVMQNNVTTYDDIYAYVNQQSDELKEAFYTALGRERESKYRANNSVDFYSVLILGNSGGRDQYEEVVKCITNKLNEDENIQATYIFSNDGTFLTETLEEQKEKYHLIIEESLTWASIISTDKLISAFNSTNIMTIGNDNTASNISLIKSAEYAGDRTYVAAKMTNLGEKVLKDMQPLGNSSDTGQYVIKFKDEVDVLYTGTYTGKKEGEFDLIGYVKNNNYKWIHSQFSFDIKIPNHIKGLIRLVKFAIEGTGKNNDNLPYIPSGYSKVAGTDLRTGFVIQDCLGNQFVWVEVPKTEIVYHTAGLNIKKFTDTEYTKIENDLKTYTSVYRNGTTYSDKYSSQTSTGLTENQYNTQKKKMLKSIYKNGGFYVGRYETGIENSSRYYGVYGQDFTTENAVTETPVIKANAYPFNYVTRRQAQELSMGFATVGTTSSLMFGVQYDLVLKYLETKGTRQYELLTDSSLWGNYQNTTFNITNSNARYSTTGSKTWTLAPYNKSDLTQKVLLTTGASGKFSKQNIHDLAGNVFEWTLEYGSSVAAGVYRGASAYFNGDERTASFRIANGSNTNNMDMGFRVALYTDEYIEEVLPKTYTITYYANGGTGNLAPQTKKEGEDLTLSSGEGLERYGYEFVGWSTSSDATSAEYAPGGKYSHNANATLYAVWQEEPENQEITITYKPNGAMGLTRTQTFNEGESKTVFSNTYIRSGYMFKEWNTSSDGTGESVVPGTSIKPPQNMTLYAIWEKTSGDIIITPVVPGPGIEIETM